MKKQSAKSEATEDSAGGNGTWSVRDGGTRLHVGNSGLEVWLYDDGHFRMLDDSAALDFEREGSATMFREMAGKGIFVGYSLCQDDELDVAVYVGSPLTEAELSVARWLEPQKAFLRLPTGKLCVESNDARRVGQDVQGAEGGTVAVPPGDYQLWLYRIDHEALDREGMKWSGPQEVIVLTPGGTADDAADDLLPYELRRDLKWVGQYTIEGRRAEALVWFPDYWDTFVLNLDSAAARKLSLVPGSYLRTHVPAADITLISAFADSWQDANRIPLPAGVPLEEYGFAAFIRMSEWNQQEALFCRRERTGKRIEDPHHNVWMPAAVEVLEAQPLPKRTGRELAPARMETMGHLYDSSFLSLILSDVLPEVADMDELPLADALGKLDKKLRKLGVTPQGDFSLEEKLHGAAHDATEVTCRFYTGLPNGFVAIFACEGIFELLLLSECEDKTWIITGLADDVERLVTAAGNKGIHIESMDEELSKIFTAHKKSLSNSKKPFAPAPANATEAAAAFSRFLATAFD